MPHVSEFQPVPAARHAMIEHGFEPDYPKAALDQLHRELASPAPEPALPNTQDLRHLLWSSIDNDTSRDLDQIEHAETLPDHRIRVRVGIAAEAHDLRAPSKRRYPALQGVPLAGRAACESATRRRAQLPLQRQHRDVSGALAGERLQLRLRVGLEAAVAVEVIGREVEQHRRLRRDPRSALL